MTFAHSRMHASRVILAAVIAVAGILLLKAKAQNDAEAKILPPSNSTLNGRKIVSSVFETNSTGVNTIP
jgi:hypothetical protein